MTYDEALERWASNLFETEIASGSVALDTGTEWSGGCETCGYYEVVIEVTANDTKGRRLYKTLNNDLGGLLREILSASNGEN